MVILREAKPLLDSPFLYKERESRDRLNNLLFSFLAASVIIASVRPKYEDKEFTWCKLLVSRQKERLSPFSKS